MIFIQIFALLIVLINIFASLQDKNYHSSLGWSLALCLYIISQIPK